MPDEVIPEDIKHFILQNIDSIAQWEGLLLLRENADEKWDAETVAQRLYIDAPVASALLVQLTQQGFLSSSIHGAEHRYQYWPGTPELEEMVGRAAQLYARHLVPITHLIHSKPKNRIQEFADAFRLRKD